MDNPKTQFALRGFSEVMGFRVFMFEGISSDRTRKLFTIKADLALTRRYGIRLQELPLLCKAALERCHESGQERPFMYTEEDMSLYAEGAAARELAAKQRKHPRRPATENVGAAWRGQQR